MAAILQLRRGTSNASPILTEGELYLHQSSGSIQFGSGSNTYTLLPLSAPINGNINLVGNISASSLNLTGNATVAGNISFGGGLITLGDNATTDNIVIVADLSSSIIPNNNNAFDLGASDKKWKNLYAVSASIDSILVPGSGILSSSDTSFASYTGSINDKNLTLANVTSSLLSSQTNLNSYTSSQDTKNSTLGNYTASVDSKLTNLINVTGSYATTGSNSFIGNQQITGSLSLSSGQFNVTTGSGALTSSLSFRHTTFDPITGIATLELRYKNNDVGPENNAWKFMASDSGVSLVFEQDGVDRTLLSSNNAGDALIFRDTRLFGKGLTVDNNLTVTGSLIVLGGITGSIAATNGVVSGSSQIVGILSELNTFSASEESKNTTLGLLTSSLLSFTASEETKNTTLGLVTSSLLLFTASEESKNTTLAIYTGSIDTKWTTIENVTASVLSYTQSLKDAITVSGVDGSSTTTIKGNLVVAGTQTSINSTAIVLGDNIIELNGTGVANGGLLVKDPTGASVISGSLLWDSTNDYWKAGQLGVESKILLAGGDGIVSSSAQITPLLPTGVVSGSQQVTASLDDRYLTIGGDSVVSSSAQIVSILSDLNSYTSSQDTKNSTLQTYSGSINDKWNTLSNVTASLINATSSYETKGRGIVSGSSQVTPLLPTGVVSGSSQILGGSDILSGSTAIVSTTAPSISKTGSLWFNNDDGNLYVKYDTQWIPTFGLPLLPAGLVSASSDTTNVDITITGGTISANLKGGVVSGSNQLSSSYNLLYAPSASFATLLGANTLASLGSAAFYYVSQSIADGNPNTLGSAFAIKTYVDDSMVLAGAGDITSVVAGNGLSGGAESGSATLTLNTGSAHFTNGVDARLIPLTSLNSYTSSQDTKNSTLAIYTASIDSHISNLNTATSSYETKGRGIVSGSSQITPLLPTGTVSGSSQIFGGSGLVSGSSQITYANISSIPAGIVSGSSQVTPLLPTGVVSGSSQVTPLLPTGVVSGSSQIIYADISSIPAGIISGSSQLSGTTITDLTIVNLTTISETASVIFSSGSNRFGDFGNDTHSFTGSVQVSGSLTTIGDVSATSFNGVINATNGVISGSTQLTATLPSGVVSGSSQIILLLPSGVVSGSSQVDADSITNFDSNVKAKLDAETVVSGSSQITRTLQQITDTGASTTNAITISNATASTTKTTGALIVTGGIGVSGDINAGGDIVAFASSDIRLKNNIKPIQSPLEKISKINGCEFEWNADLQTIYSGKDYGVIAQEIEEVFPELVQTRENGYKAVKYDKLVSVLIEGIKELTKQVEYLKTKIEN